MIGTVQTQKIFFAMGTVNTITVFEEADETLSASLLWAIILKNLTHLRLLLSLWEQRRAWSS